jgi:hypothetical protein
VALIREFSFLFGNMLVLALLALLFLLECCNVTDTYAQESIGLNDQINASDKQQLLKEPTLSINTDRKVYGEGDIVRIFGYVYNGTIFPLNEKVKITTENIESKEITDNVSVVTAQDGSYNHTVSNTENGRYKANAFVNINGIKESAVTTFQIKSIFWTIPAQMLYVGVAFFLALMVVIFFGRKLTEGIEKEGEKIFLIEILRFIFLSAIVSSFIVALIFSEVEIGANSPIGLIIKDPSENVKTGGEGAANSDDEGSQWMINVGGSAADNFAGGIQIPATVLIFGVAGGYLRYLYGLRYLYEKKTSGQLDHTEREWGDINIDDKLALFKHSLRSLSLFFLSPLLAIAVWFVIFQGGTTGKYSIAAISFTLGLVTEEVIQALIGFARSILGGITGTAGRQSLSIWGGRAETKGGSGVITVEGAPTVLSTIPNDKSTGVAVNTPIKATFNETLDKSSINNYTVNLKDSNNESIEIGVSLSEDGKTVTMIPKNNLSSSSNYVATISAGVKDLSGTAMPKEKTWSFGTLTNDTITT